MPVESQTRRLPLDVARQQLQRLIGKTVLPAAMKREAHIIGIRASVGVGKTRTTAQYLRGAIVRPGNNPIRALYLVPTREILTDLAKDYFTDERTGELYPHVGIAFPRIETEGPGYCAQFKHARALGQLRHSITGTLCKRCPDRAGCQYHATRDALRTKAVVLATHESYPTLQCLEVSLRNALHGSLTASAGSAEWYTILPMGSYECNSINEATQRLQKSGKATLPHIVQARRFLQSRAGCL